MQHGSFTNPFHNETYFSFLNFIIQLINTQRTRYYWRWGLKQQYDALINAQKRYHYIDSIAKVTKPGVLDEQAFPMAKQIDGGIDDNLDSIMMLAVRYKYNEAAFFVLRVGLTN